MLRPVIILLLVVGTSVAAFFASEKHLHKLSPDQVIRLDGVSGLSGITYWPAHKTLIAVASSGELTEIALDGKVLRRRPDFKHELGDIALGKEPGYALVTDVQEGRLLQLSLADLHFVSDIPPDLDAQSDPSQQARFEGLAIERSSGRLILASNVAPAALLFADNPGATPRNTILLNTPSVSSVISGDNGQLLVVSPDSGLLLTSADGIPLGDWRPVTGQPVTGATLVPGLGLVLVTAHEPAQLLIFSSLKNWEDVRHALKH